MIVSLLYGCGDKQPKILPQSAFQVDFGKHQVPREMREAETIVAEVWLGNTGNGVWPNTADAKVRKQVNWFYHWLDADQKVVILDGLRTHLPRDLNPGATMLLNVSIQAPSHAGQYILQLSMVQEAVAWFHEKGEATLDVPVRVVAVGAVAPTAKLNRVAGLSSATEISRSKRAAAKKSRR